MQATRTTAEIIHAYTYSDDVFIAGASQQQLSVLLDDIIQYVRHYNNDTGDISTILHTLYAQHSAEPRRIEWWANHR